MTVDALISLIVWGLIVHLLILGFAMAALERGIHKKLDEIILFLKANERHWRKK